MAADVEMGTESLGARRRSAVVDFPDVDARIEAMDGATRNAVADTWQRRAGEELKVATVFSILCRELLEAGADGDVVMSVSRAIHDEVRHGEICRRLAARYRGGDVAWPRSVALNYRAAPPPVPRRLLFSIAEMCCVNEAVAAAYLDASFAGATGPCARAALRELLRDEVEHARFGWVYLGRAVQAGDAREALAAQIVPIVQTVVGCWFDESAITLPDGMSEDGLPSVAVMKACALTAVRDIVLPGFASLGFDVRAAREWVEGQEA